MLIEKRHLYWAVRLALIIGAACGIVIGTMIGERFAS